MMTLNQNVSIWSKLVLLILCALSVGALIYFLFFPFNVCSGPRRSSPPYCRNERPANLFDRIIPVGGLLLLSGVLVGGKLPLLKVRSRRLHLSRNYKTLTQETESYFGGPERKEIAYEKIKRYPLVAKTKNGPPAPATSEYLYFLDADNNILTYYNGKIEPDMDRVAEDLRAEYGEETVTEGMPPIDKLALHMTGAFARPVFWVYHRFKESGLAPKVPPQTPPV